MALPRPHAREKAGGPTRRMKIWTSEIAFLAVFVTAMLGQWAARKLLLPGGDNDVGGSASAAPRPTRYAPGGVERFVMDHADAYGFASSDDPPSCAIYQRPTPANPTPHGVRADLLAYLDELRRYNEAVEKFEPIGDLMKGIERGEGGSRALCAATRLHPDGLRGLFPSGQLSLTSSGYVEPLLPPMRHPDYCLRGEYRKFRKMEHLMAADYLIHDFEAMCLKLKPHSKLVLVDMGASLDFHLYDHGSKSPVFWLLEIYEKFGFRFDHIYAFEVEPKEVTSIYGAHLPKRYIPAYHWINAGVSPDPSHRLNPLYSIVRAFDEDDLIVVKLDIDRGSVEVPLARQLLEDEVFSRLVDHFYFEHHVHMKEIASSWKESMNGTIKESLELFRGLREAGIAAHFWP